MWASLQEFNTLNGQLVQSEGWQDPSSSRRSSRAAGPKGRQAAFHNSERLMWRGRAKLWDPDSLGILNQIGQNYARSYFVASQVSQLAIRGVAVNTSSCGSLCEYQKFDLERQKILHKYFSLQLYFVLLVLHFVTGKVFSGSCLSLSRQHLNLYCLLPVLQSEGTFLLLYVCARDGTCNSAKTSQWLPGTGLWAHWHPLVEIKLPVHWNRNKAEKVKDSVSVYAWNQGLQSTMPSTWLFGLQAHVTSSCPVFHPPVSVETVPVRLGMFG